MREASGVSPPKDDSGSDGDGTDVNLSEDEVAHRVAVSRRQEAQEALAKRLAAADAALARKDATKVVVAAVHRLDGAAGDAAGLPVAQPTTSDQATQPPLLSAVLSPALPAGRSRDSDSAGKGTDAPSGTPRRTSLDDDSVVLPSDSSDGMSTNQRDAAGHPEGLSADLETLVAVRPIKLADNAGQSTRPPEKVAPSQDHPKPPTEPRESDLAEPRPRSRSRSESRRRHRPRARAEILAEPSPVEDAAASSTDDGDEHARRNVVTPPKGAERFLDGDRGVVWSPMQRAVATRLVVTFPVGEAINVSIVGGERVGGGSVAAPQQYTPIVVESVDPSSRANNYHLRPGDELVSLNGTSVTGSVVFVCVCLCLRLCVFL